MEEVTVCIFVCLLGLLVGVFIGVMATGNSADWLCKEQFKGEMRNGKCVLVEVREITK